MSLPPSARSSLALIEQAVRRLGQPPVGFTFEAVELGLEPGLGRLRVGQARDVLAHRDTPIEVKNRAWALLVTRVQRNEQIWTLATIGIALPRLRRLAAELASGHPGCHDELDQEIVTGFLTALTEAHTPAQQRFPALIRAARRAGLAWLRHDRLAAHPVRDIDQPRPTAASEADSGTRHTTRYTAAHPAARPGPYPGAGVGMYQSGGHPEDMLVDAVAAGVLTDAEAEIIAATRLEGRPLGALAPAHGVSVKTLWMRRDRAEKRLVNALSRAVAADDTDRASDPTYAHLLDTTALAQRLDPPAAARRNPPAQPSSHAQASATQPAARAHPTSRHTLAHPDGHTSPGSGRARTGHGQHEHGQHRHGHSQHTTRPPAGCGQPDRGQPHRGQRASGQSHGGQTGGGQPHHAPSSAGHSPGQPAGSRPPGGHDTTGHPAAAGRHCQPAPAGVPGGSEAARIRALGARSTRGHAHPSRTSRTTNSGRSRCGTSLTPALVLFLLLSGGVASGSHAHLPFTAGAPRLVATTSATTSATTRTAIFSRTVSLARWAAPLDTHLAMHGDLPRHSHTPGAHEPSEPNTVPMPAPAQATANGTADGTAQLTRVLTNIRNWLMGLLITLATLLLTFGGVRYLIAGGDPGEVEAAKRAVKSAAIGYALAALAPALVAILHSLVGA